MGDTFHDTNKLIRAPVISESDQPQKGERGEVSAEITSHVHARLHFVHKDF